MSAFLGPIHTWLFTKIKFQDALNKELLEKLGDRSLKEALDRRYGALEEGELAEIIDGSNIHGWLQERISLVENHLAYITLQLKEKDSTNLEKICQVARVFGKANAENNLESPRAAYDYLEKLLVNGMPCDRVNALVEDSQNKLIWEQTIEIHGQYWEPLGADVNDYYKIRQAVIEGILEDSKISFEQNQAGDFILQMEE
ncbi:MAG TPA: hypothetical protein VIR32_02395 [Lachnospiraceae bacterium]